MINKPSLVTKDKFRFLILDAPTSRDAKDCVEQLKNAGVKNLVRSCEGTYDEKIFESEGINVHVTVIQNLYFHIKFSKNNKKMMNLCIFE